MRGSSIFPIIYIGCHFRWDNRCHFACQLNCPLLPGFLTFCMMARKLRTKPDRQQSAVSALSGSDNDPYLTFEFKQHTARATAHTQSHINIICHMCTTPRRAAALHSSLSTPSSSILSSRTLAAPPPGLSFCGRGDSLPHPDLPLNALSRRRRRRRRRRAVLIASVWQWLPISPRRDARYQRRWRRGGGFGTALAAGNRAEARGDKRASLLPSASRAQAARNGRQLAGRFRARVSFSSSLPPPQDAPDAHRHSGSGCGTGRRGPGTRRRAVWGGLRHGVRRGCSCRGGP